MAVKKPTLFAAPLANNGSKWSIGTETNVMKGLSQFHDPLINWSVESYSIDSLGESIALVVRNPSEDMAVTPRVDIYLVSADNSVKPKLLTGSFNAISDSPVFIKDGKKSVAREWDCSPESIVWSANGQTIFAVATDQGNNIIFAINATTGNCTRMTDAGSAMGLGTLGENQLLFQYTEQNKCVDIHILDIETKEMRRLTDVNSDKLRNVYIGQAEYFWFKGALGDQVHGWIIKPLQFNTEKKYPLALVVHGGPQASIQNIFTSTMWNSNIFANTGFVTVQINFHGSTGYGKNFTDSIKHQWGRYPYEDLMIELDHVLDNCSYVDKARMGWSRWVRVTAALVCHAGIFSTPGAWYGTNELWLPEHDFGGTPYDPKARSNHEEFNPERFANEFATPTLFIHGGSDYRVGVEQSLAPFTLLRRKNIPTKFVYFPDEDHHISSDVDQIKWLTEVLLWISEHTNTTLPYNLNQ
ncbi:Alpha/Beta hydrolase protein [Kickxella alabastrina]|uniref:Alpha/Beta hydrolase protein n=1 Tax=Kickxella alabastrina TaxID=61397 RepID=UPI00221EA4CD|nr:Alpha/Beta hydrolase protein [Kickxella alabastrina]KAI7822812.1 Alpha/Beta hydrolase protein [Kickxella alabastrina]